MKIGIVGAEAKKFTELGKHRARDEIAGLLLKASVVISGHCHLGGIDIWAEELADAIKLPKEIYPPKKLSWWGGYRDRNLEIAHASDIVYCIAVDRLPDDYRGMKFDGCYHCGRTDHVKSGGCWTMKKAAQGELIIVSNY